MRLTRSGSRLPRRAGAAVVAAAMLLVSGTGLAAGPRWTAGRTYFQSPDGRPVIWNTPQLRYYTDPGDLSASVDHAAADHLVAAAAAMWTVDHSSIVLSQGGVLQEHVSSGNMYLGPNGPVFPTDVQASNGSAMPIAILYDTDGSVTDTLLGGGASDPGNCRQSAVTESVDGISTAAQITHALIVLNGRCTGADPQLQMEMQYKLGRAIGRVLGLGWSQANDNVWTGTPLATYQQALHWPLMHPVDILCGPYAYQCTVQPFTLKTDDLASLITLYPVATTGGGKTASYEQATYITGRVTFSDGQGMQGVNVVSRVRHQATNATDTWDSTSSVSGYQFQEVGGNPVTPKGNTLAASFGSSGADSAYYRLGWIPAPWADQWEDITVYTEAVNPLYTGQYAVGPYQNAQVTPSGPPLSREANFIGSFNTWDLSMTATSGAGQCSTSGDGSENGPAPIASTGMWSSTMCRYGHTAWSSLAVKAGRSLAVEVTALDEGGYATIGKLQPVIGLWEATDPTGTTPTLGSQTDSMNTTSLGMTSLLFASGSAAHHLRMGMGDVRGDGRPDFKYNARVLYADAILPLTLPANGGQVTITGMGFKNGNAVSVNGVAATVQSWSATSIVAVAPALTGTGAMDVTVTDVATGSQTTMTGALMYSGTTQPDALTIVSAPGNGAAVGMVATPNLTVQVMLPDGTTPAIGASVTVSAANATLGGCGASCVLTSDATGKVSAAVTPSAAGTVTLTATVGQATATASFTAAVLANDVLSVYSMPSGTVYAGVAAGSPFGVQVMLGDGTTPASNVQATVSATNATLGGCSGAATCTMTTDPSGKITTTVTPVAAGTVSLLATANRGSVSASFGATAMPPNVVNVVSTPANGSYVGRPAATPFSARVLYGDGVTPGIGMPVTVTGAGATLAGCAGATSCVMTTNASGMVTTGVTPTAAGSVTLAASGGSTTMTAGFTAVAAPVDTLQLTMQPANGSYAGRAAATPLGVQVLLGTTGAAAAGASVTMTAINATLGACGGASCVMTADGNGRVSTTVTPGSAGSVMVTISEGGGTATATFQAAAAPVDVLRVVAVPADGSYFGTGSTVPFTVQVLLGDTNAPAAGATVTVRSTNAMLGCWAPVCVMTADGTGTIAATVWPVASGPVSLTALAGGGTATATFRAAPSPPNELRVVSAPGNGSPVGQVAAIPFVVQINQPGGAGVAAWASGPVTAVNATLGACGRRQCWAQADATGKLTTTVTPTAPGEVVLTMSQGGGTVSTTFNGTSVQLDRLQVVGQPSGTVYAGVATTSPFAIQVTQPDAVTLAAGAAVTVTVTNGRLAACAGAATCVLTADAMGKVSTVVTPTVAGPVTLTATAGGGTVSATVAAAALPPDTVRVLSVPSGTVYVGEVATARFAVQVMLGDGSTPAAGVSVTLSGAAFGSCPGSPCVLVADGTGTVSTTVTPNAAGPVTLTATAGGVSGTATFPAVNRLLDVLQVVSAPGNGSYLGQVAATPFSVQVMLGDGTTRGAGVSVTLTAAGATLGVCGQAVCVVTANGSGVATTTVTPGAAGPVSLTAAAGGGSATATFNAVAVPPDVLQALSAPADGSYVGQVAATPLRVQVMLGDGVTPAAGVAVRLSVSGATLSVCGRPPCVVAANAAGIVTTSVTPAAVGPVSWTASAGGGTVSGTFNAVAVPPDVLQVVTVPANGSYVGQLAGTPFSVQVRLGDGTTAAAAVSVTLTASGGTLGVCGQPVCVVTANAAGVVTTTVTPAAAGPVVLTAAAGGGTATATFNAVAVPPDVLQVVTVPANGSYFGQVAATPFSVQVRLGDGTTAAAGVSVTLTASGGTLGVCGQPVCVATANGAGVVTTTVTPAAAGPVVLTAAAGGGTATATFNAVAVPPDVLQVVAVPANGSYFGQVAATPFSVQVRLGDGTTAAAGVAVTLTASGGTFGTCGQPVCVVSANGAGVVTTTVTPAAAGPVVLTAAAGGGTATATFNAVAVPPDVLQVVAVPANGSYFGQVAATPFSVQVRLGDGTTAAAGVAVTLSAAGATLGVCGQPVCVVSANGAGVVTTTVTPAGANSVGLTASAGGGTVTATFNAVPVPPDVLQVVTVPANGSYVGQAAATSFRVQVMLGNGTTPAAGAAVTLSAAGATLGLCGLPSCVVTASGTGVVSTTVTPTAPGSVGLTASAAGGTVTTSFNAVPVPPDVLQVLSAPGNGSYVGTAATAPLIVQVHLADGTTPAAGAAVTVTVAGGILGACGAASCVLTADAQGRVQTMVTSQAAGSVSLSAAAGGGTVSATFVAMVRPDVLQLVSTPDGTVYVGFVAGTRFGVQVMLGDGVTAAAGVEVALAATGASLAVCGGATCTVTSDAFGMAATDVTPTVAGGVTVQASAGGGTVSTTFVAVDPVRGVTLARTAEYVAPGIAVAYTPAAGVFENGNPSVGAAVLWTVNQGGGMSFAVASSVTDAQGNTSNPGVIGPLAAGQTATGQACAWTTICVPFSAVAVDPSRWRLVVVSGGTQDVAVAETLQPVKVRVVDDAGHWIAGASVSLRQVVDGWVDCPASGRCPIAPVLGQSSATLVSDADGLVVATPLEVAGVHERTRMVLATGLNGYTAIGLDKSH